MGFLVWAFLCWVVWAICSASHSVGAAAYSRTHLSLAKGTAENRLLSTLKFSLTSRVWPHPLKRKGGRISPFPVLEDQKMSGLNGVIVYWNSEVLTPDLRELTQKLRESPKQ